MWTLEIVDKIFHHQANTAKFTLKEWWTKERKKLNKKKWHEWKFTYLVILIVWIMCYHFQLNAHSRPSHCPSTRGPLCQQYFPLICFVCSLVPPGETLLCLLTFFFDTFSSSPSTHQIYHRWYVEWVNVEREIHELSSGIMMKWVSVNNWKFHILSLSFSLPIILLN